MEASWDVLETSWTVLSVSWGALAPSWGVLEASWERLGASWGVFAASWRSRFCLMNRQVTPKSRAQESPRAAKSAQEAPRAAQEPSPPSKPPFFLLRRLSRHRPAFKSRAQESPRGAKKGQERPTAATEHILACLGSLLACPWDICVASRGILVASRERSQKKT